MRTPRRTLLAGVLTLPAMAARAQPQPLRQRLTELRVGANIERWFAVAANNHPRRLGVDWWRQFRQAGFDHARMFIPNPKDSGESPDLLELFLQAVSDANRAGLPVLLGLLDSFHQSSPWSDREWRVLNARAAFFGARTDPNQVVLAALNEAAFPDAQSWAPMRDRLLETVRGHAPRHVLSWGGWEWCSLRSLLDMPPPRDANCIAEVHDYQGGTSDEVAHRFGQAAAWRSRNNMPVLVTELGGVEAHRQDPPALAADLRQSLPALRRLKLPASLWAYTHGSWWRLQNDQSPTPREPFRPLLA
jgi:hypothetical protein